MILTILGFRLMLNGINRYPMFGFAKSEHSGDSGVNPQI